MSNTYKYRCSPVNQQEGIKYNFFNIEEKKDIEFIFDNFYMSETSKSLKKNNLIKNNIQVVLNLDKKKRSNSHQIKYNDFIECSMKSWDYIKNTIKSDDNILIYSHNKQLNINVSIYCVLSCIYLDKTDNELMLPKIIKYMSSRHPNIILDKIYLEKLYKYENELLKEIIQ